MVPGPPSSTSDEGRGAVLPASTASYMATAEERRKLVTEAVENVFPPIGLLPKEGGKRKRPSPGFGRRGKPLNRAGWENGGGWGEWGDGRVLPPPSPALLTSPKGRGKKSKEEEEGSPTKETRGKENEDEEMKDPSRGVEEKGIAKKDGKREFVTEPELREEALEKRFFGSGDDSLLEWMSELGELMDELDTIRRSRTLTPREVTAKLPRITKRAWELLPEGYKRIEDLRAALWGLWKEKKGNMESERDKEQEREEKGREEWDEEKKKWKQERKLWEEERKEWKRKDEENKRQWKKEKTEWGLACEVDRRYWEEEMEGWGKKIEELIKEKGAWELRQKAGEKQLECYREERRKWNEERREWEQKEKEWEKERSRGRSERMEGLDETMEVEGADGEPMEEPVPMNTSSAEPARAGKGLRGPEGPPPGGLGRHGGAPSGSLESKGDRVRVEGGRVPGGDPGTNGLLFAAEEEGDRGERGPGSPGRGPGTAGSSSPTERERCGATAAPSPGGGWEVAGKRRRQRGASTAAFGPPESAP